MRVNVRVGALPTSKADIKHFFCIYADRRSRGVFLKLCVYAADCDGATELVSVPSE